MKVLVTGFDPFDNDTVNPAWEAVSRMKDEIAGAKIVKLMVPTVFGKSVQVIREAMDREQPDVVLSVGLSGGRGDITPERVAINLSDARIPDNEGNQPTDEAIFPDGPDAYFSMLPVKAMVEKIHGRGLPASVSTTAGTFVCNHVMYGVLYHVHKDFPNTRSGFVHIPYIPSQTVDKRFMPSMNLNDTIAGLEAAVEAIIENSEDIHSPGGTLH
ncbi:MAG: pyroglutamyl-peptidase I [Lachnospiraceae bacterium]|nr:pyroglutamyl-peptidase I [Lachnospiraceae bacterium]MCD8010806.1 pyroglutamyl-peptidase I [Lachnospiraceae bacterium]